MSVFLILLIQDFIHVMDQSSADLSAGDLDSGILKCSGKILLIESRIGAVITERLLYTLRKLSKRNRNRPALAWSWNSGAGNAFSAFHKRRKPEEDIVVLWACVRQMAVRFLHLRGFNPVVIVNVVDAEAVMVIMEPDDLLPDLVRTFTEAVDVFYNNRVVRLLDVQGKNHIADAS